MKNRILYDFLKLRKNLEVERSNLNQMNMYRDINNNNNNNNLSRDLLSKNNSRKDNININQISPIIKGKEKEIEDDKSIDSDQEFYEVSQFKIFF